MVSRVYSIRETQGQTNSYTIYRLDNPPANYSEIEALTAFSHSWVNVNPHRVDGHWIIEHHVEVRGADNVQRVPVGIAHTDEELPDKTYGLARVIAQQLAKKEVFAFRDLTARGKLPE